LKTSARPPLRSSALARPEVAPLLQQTSTGLPAGSSPIRLSSSASGMFRAFGRWPAAKSADARTSSTTAPVSLISLVAPRVSSAGPPARPMIIGHSSIAPEAKAIAIRKMFSVMKSTSASGSVNRRL